jgi:hypothetical protein
MVIYNRMFVLNNMLTWPAATSITLCRPKHAYNLPKAAVWVTRKRLQLLQMATRIVPLVQC